MVRDSYRYAVQFGMFLSLAVKVFAGIGMFGFFCLSLFVARDADDAIPLFVFNLCLALGFTVAVFLGEVVRHLVVVIVDHAKNARRAGRR